MVPISVICMCNMADKKVGIASSSIIDLKAELFRKQQEFKQQKLDSLDGYARPKPVEKKVNIWSKKNAGVLQRSQKDIEVKEEEDNVHEKSRKSLEAKAKLYEKMTEGNEIPEEDGSKMFLIDFQKKVIDDIVEKREKDRKEEKERQAKTEDDILAKVDLPLPADEDEEWVDYTDDFGRSRRCMRKDLPANQQWLKDKHTAKGNHEDVSPQLLSNDMRREMLRQKWEEEEKAAMNQPIHYANVQFDEIRSHGVGFYQFAKDELTRQEQLQTLSNIRQKTKEERDWKDKIKEKRKAMMEARLAKVKQRKMQRENEGIFGLNDHEGSDKDDETITGQLQEESIEGKTKESHSPKKEETKNFPSREWDKGKNNDSHFPEKEEETKKKFPIREWDKGKKNLFPAISEERYLEDRRSERFEEFAPPVFYYEDTSTKNKQTDLKPNIMSPANLKPSNISTADLKPNISPAGFRPNISPADFRPNISLADFRPNILQAGFRPNISPADFRPNITPAEFRPNISQADIRPNFSSADFRPDIPSADFRPNIFLPADIDNTPQPKNVQDIPLPTPSYHTGLQLPQNSETESILPQTYLHPSHVHSRTCITTNHTVPFVNSEFPTINQNQTEETTLEDTQKPRTTNYTIIDPRLVQNRAVLESEVPNLSVSKR